ncbi:MAG: response regulator [Rhizobium sp.]|nr:response regulator [Rhizobium sp.]
MPTDRNDSILIVENEPLIAMDLEAMLASAGFHGVTHVVSCEAAMLWLEQSSPRLAILDLQVADGTTTPVAESLRDARTPFVIYSGHSREDAARAGVFDHAVWLPKPCTEGDLVAAVHRALGLPLG